MHLTWPQYTGSPSWLCADHAECKTFACLQFNTQATNKQLMSPSVQKDMQITTILPESQGESITAGHVIIPHSPVHKLVLHKLKL